MSSPDPALEIRATAERLLRELERRWGGRGAREASQPVSRSSDQKLVEPSGTRGDEARVDRDAREIPPPVPKTLASILTMPLDQYAREGSPLEVRVPGLVSAMLWFVADARHAESLVTEGISRGRIWTAHELMDLMTLRALTPEQVSLIAMTKLVFDGSLEEVRPR
jgi:hypothetical protein